MSQIIQIIQIIQIRSRSSLKDLDHEVGIDYTDHLSEVCTIIGVLLFLRARD